MKKTFFLVLIFLSLSFSYSFPNNKLYEKIDLFSEVLEKIEKDYVDEIIQYANNGNENCFVIGEMIEKCESSVFFEGNLKKWSTMG